MQIFRYLLTLSFLRVIPFGGRAFPNVYSDTFVGLVVMMCQLTSPITMSLHMYAQNVAIRDLCSMFSFKTVGQTKIKLQKNELWL